ncbi:hypothetical protein IscW_ISCW016598 [Ixodes scapularis]|uniref:Uncharacterized protein n=1 Tax=Ixodes scapularis TaxID=6945 RepID=B7PBU5_IXOSC|nr:hypothetical protein IscW_ISCW016598 [Ixodes scapularis]|eukprot:XP_002408886.1 hypothetical protein IscW_ISCW016598 [Ixodes scapularis]
MPKWVRSTVHARSGVKGPADGSLSRRASDLKNLRLETDSSSRRTPGPAWTHYTPHPGPGPARGLSGPPFAAEVPGRLTSKTWGPRPDQRPAEPPGGSRTSPRAVFREAGAFHACSGTRRPKGPTRVEGRLT